MSLLSSLTDVQSSLRSLLAASLASTAMLPLSLVSMTISFVSVQTSGWMLLILVAAACCSASFTQRCSIVTCLCITSITLGLFICLYHPGSWHLSMVNMQMISATCTHGVNNMCLTSCICLGAKSGRLESLSGGSKQSQSTSSRLRLSPDSSNLLSSGRPHLHHVNSDADSHPRRATSQARLPTDSGKRSASVERQRTSDLSSRDVLDSAEDGKLKDEMQSEGVAAVRYVIVYLGTSCQLLIAPLRTFVQAVAY